MTKRIFSSLSALFAIAATAFSQGIPPQPSDVTITEQATGVVITWTAPADTDASALTYNVYNKQRDLIATGLTATTFTDTAAPLTGSQQRIYYYVAAVESGNESATTISNRLVVGDAYPLPFHDSFDKANPTDYFWWGDNTGWSSFTISDRYTVDDEYGAMMLQLYDLNDKSTINTGKISLAGADNPALMFSQGVWGGYNIKLHVYLTKANGEKELLKTYDYKDAPSREWGREVISLAAYKDEPFIMINFEPEAKTVDMPVIIDNVYVIDYLKNNLQAKVTVPKSGTIGEEAMISVRITNLGEETAKGYKVHLYKDGELFETVTDASDIPTYYDLARFFYVVPSLTDPVISEFEAWVEYAQDADQSDNRFGPVEMPIIQPSMPFVDDLTGEIDDNGCAVLRWSEPEKEQTARQTDSFETYDAWLTSGIGYWKTIDNDYTMTYGFDGIDFDHEGEPMSFMVFYPAAIGINTTNYPEWAPHSGQQYMICVAAVGSQTPDGHNDDWLISPLLSGSSQTIDFFAKAAMEDYTESFDVLYSTTGAEIEDFKLLRTVSTVPTDWTNYSQVLPEGAKYFAIRCTSANAYALMIDDISYTPAEMILERYNVYRDKTIIASVDSKTTTYTDRAANGRHDYRIGAVYNYGEARLSNTVSLQGATAIADITTDKNSSDDADIYTLDGKKTTHFSKGIYIIKDRKSGTTRKIAR